MDGEKQNKRGEEIHESVFKSILDRASSGSNGLSVESVLHYFALSVEDKKALAQAEIPVEGLSTQRLKKAIDSINGNNEIHRKFVSLIENDIHYYKQSENWGIAVAIERYLIENRLTQKEFAAQVSSSVDVKKYGEKTSISSGNLSEILMSLRSGAGPLLHAKKVSIIHDFLVSKKKSYLKTLTKDNVSFFLEEKFKKCSLTVQEKKNIQGDYVFIRRANFLTQDEANKTRNRNIIFVGLFHIEISKGVLSFSYKGEINSESNRPIQYTVDGFGIRDSAGSLKFIGFKKVSGGSTRSLVLLALSVPISDLEKGKSYINGSVIEEEDSSLKPYHTWFHLSKLSKCDDLLRKLSDSRAIFHKEDFFYRYPFGKFHVDEKEEDSLKIIRDHIRENYGNECPIKYIRNKLYMDADLVNVDIL